MNRQGPTQGRGFRPALPPDLFPRVGPAPAQHEGIGGESTADRIARDTNAIAGIYRVTRGLTPRLITVGTTPVQVVDGRQARGYIFLNTSTGSGGAGNDSGAILNSAVYAANDSGNTQANALGVASFTTLSLFLNVSANAAGTTIEIDAQTQDPVSLNWATSQLDVFGSPTATGTFYASLGQLGIDNSFAITYTVGAAGGATWSLGYVIKGGGFGSSGIANSIYLGASPNVVSTAGYPLLEGERLVQYLEAQVEVWAVSLISAGVILSVFELQ